MAATRGEPAVSRPPLKADLIDPRIVESDYDIPESTQAVWRCTNRYGWRDLVYKVGDRIRYRRSEVEQWFENRRVER